MIPPELSICNALGKLGETSESLPAMICIGTMGMFLMMIFLVAPTFIWLYPYATYTTWKYKTSPDYPSPAAVRKEILASWSGFFFNPLCFVVFVAFREALVTKGALHKGYCGHSHEK